MAAALTSTPQSLRTDAGASDAEPSSGITGMGIGGGSGGGGGGGGSGRSRPMPTTAMELRSVTGFDATPFGTGLVLGASSVLFSTGRNLARLNTENKAFSVIPCHDLTVRCLGMCISQSQKYVAVAERHAHEQFVNVSVYNVVSGLMSRHMAIPDTHAESGEVLGMAFSNGGKVLLIQMGAPDFVLILFKWVTGKLLKSIRGERDVFRVCFNPHETVASAATTALTASPQGLRFWKCDEDSLRHMSSIVPKLSGIVSYTEVEWLSQHVLAAANDRGEIIIYDEGEMISMAKPPLVRSAPSTTVADGDTASTDQQHQTEPRDTTDIITVIKSISTGFIAATRQGTLFVYSLDMRKADALAGTSSSAVAKAGDRIKLDYEAACPYVLQQTFRFCPPHTRLVALSVFPDEGTAVAFTAGTNEKGGSGVGDGSKDMLLLSLRQQETDAAARFDDVVSRFHRLDVFSERPADAAANLYDGAKGVSLFGGYPLGAVIGLALCEGSALVATISADKTLRIWNYAEQICLLAKRFIEDLLSVSIHPDGFRLLLGTNRLRMYSVTVDDVHLLHEFTAPNCRLCAFSRGGASFAAATSSVINVYNTYTFEHIATLKGHQSAVVDLSWAHADLKILSAGANGTVYQFPMVEQQPQETNPVMKSERERASSIVQVQTSAVPARLGNRDPTCEFVRKGVSMYCATFVDKDAGFVCYSSDGLIRQVSGGNVVYEVDYEPTPTAILPTAFVAPVAPASSTRRKTSTVMRSGSVVSEERGSRITSLTMGIDGKTLFAATSDGTVRLYAWPPTEDDAPGAGRDAAVSAATSPAALSGVQEISRASSPAPSRQTPQQPLPSSPHKSRRGRFKEYRLHSSPIRFMRLNSTGNKLFTACAEGLIVSNEVVYFNKYGNRIAPTVPGIIAAPAGGSPGKAGSGEFAEKGELAFGSALTLVYRTSLGEYEGAIKNLEHRIHELRQENAMQAMFKEQANAEVVSKLKEELMNWQLRYDEAVKEGNVKVGVLEADYNEKIRSLETSHIRGVEELQSRYEKRLSVHQGAHAKAREDLEDAQLRFEEKEKLTGEAHAREIAQLMHNAQEKDALAQHEFNEAKDQHEHESRELHALVHETERDGDEEMERVHMRMSAEVKEKEEAISVLKAENYLLRSAMDRQVEECKTLRERQSSDAETIAEFKSTAERLNYTVGNLMKEVQQRDELNNTKEDVIMTLRTENRQLMKVKFILNYKFEELKQQVEPREAKMRSMQVQLSGQDDALSAQLKEIDLLKNSISDKTAKIKGLDSELGRLRAVLADRNATLSQVLHDIAMSIEDNRGRGGIAQDKRIVDIYDHYRTQLDANGSIATAMPTQASVAATATANNENYGGGGNASAAALHGKPPFILLSKSRQTRLHSAPARRSTSATTGDGIPIGVPDTETSAGDREAGQQILYLEKRAALLEKRTGMIEKNKERDAFVMQRENARLLCEMHELQKTNITLKRQLASRTYGGGGSSSSGGGGDADAATTAAADIDGQSASGVEAGGAGGATATATDSHSGGRGQSATRTASHTRPRPKSASVLSSTSHAAGRNQQKRPMTGSVHRAMRAMSSVDKDQMISCMNKVEEQEKTISALRGEVEMLREQLAVEKAGETLSIIQGNPDMQLTRFALSGKGGVDKRGLRPRPHSAAPARMAF